jgi:hypothetical protein
VDAFSRRFSLRVVSSSERIFSRKRGNHEKENRCFLCSVQRWRSARRLALGHRAAALAVEQAERAGVLQAFSPTDLLTVNFRTIGLPQLFELRLQGVGAPHIALTDTVKFVSRPQYIAKYKGWRLHVAYSETL